MVQVNSALSNDVKLASLSEEITRRLRNASLELDLSRRLEILEDACVKKKTSGHADKFIREAVSKGIRNFKEKVSRSMLPETNKGYLPLYQGGHWKRIEKAKVKTSWYLDNEN
jgi:hypothetical protein